MPQQSSKKVGFTLLRIPLLILVALLVLLAIGVLIYNRAG
jgi:hypothetical protein